MGWRRYFHRADRDEEAAREAALRKFGNSSLVREETYRANSLGSLENLWFDLRFALRTVRKNPMFALTAVLILAIFTVIRAVLLKPLAYPGSDRLVYLSLDNPRRNGNSSFALQRLEEMRAAAQSYSGLGAFGRQENFTFAGGGEPEALKGARVSANFLDILGIKPILGRSFLPEEDSPGGRPVAMISAALWKRQFAGDLRVAGNDAGRDALHDHRRATGRF